MRSHRSGNVRQNHPHKFLHFRAEDQTREETQCALRTAAFGSVCARLRGDVGKRRGHRAALAKLASLQSVRRGGETTPVVVLDSPALVVGCEVPRLQVARAP